MNADILRLILFLGGVGLILGIYFWDRHKKVTSRVHAIKRAQFESESELSMSEIEGDVPASESEEFSITGTTDLNETIPPADSEPLDSEDIDLALGELGQMVRSDGQPEDQDDLPIKEKQGAFSFTTDEMDLHLNDYADADLPVLILQLNIVASQAEGFAGNAILRASKEVELEYGEFNIFHRFADPAKKGHVLFSMASMVEPGSFLLKEMSSFSTPGLTLFCQLPGPKDGVAVFADMLFTAERLAALLQGELQDETHSVLSKQTIEHLRETVLEHGRQVQLVRSKKARH